jgi:oxygen-independent coproporphyrinogen-3 oxidase
VRFANAEELAEYEAGVGGEVREVGEREAFEEGVFLGLRMNAGIAVADLRARFAREWVDDCEARVRELAREGLMHVEDGRWRLTMRGRLVSSEVFGELLAVGV